MKIFVLDSWRGKFTNPIIDHWKTLGHEVNYNGSFEEMADCDIVFVYPADNQLVEISTQKLPKRGKVYANCIDIEAWTGQPQAVDWSYVDGLTFISPHIMRMVLSQITPPEKVKLIRPGINLDKFYLRPPADFTKPVRRVAYVTGSRRIWDVKRLDIALMMIRDLLDKTGLIWQLHILGSYSSHVQYNDYCEHLLDSLDLRNFVFWYEYRDDISSWLDDKDYFFIASTKEAFSYATAEAMAKGIKPVLGNWRGVSDTWSIYANKTYNRMYERFIEKEYKPEEYRSFVVNHYDEKRYFKELDEFIGLT